jgi:hypothetical protein
MTAAEIARLLDARPCGRGKWRGPCPSPAHLSNSPKLSIREGDDGRTLIHCFAGCRIQDVLEAAQLLMSDLFAGPPPTPEQRRRADAERQQREAEAEVRRRQRRLLADRYRTLSDTVHTIGARLVVMPEGREGDALALVYHAAIDKFHDIEAIYAQQELAGFHERLIRCCETQHIDRQHLLAPYMDADAADQYTEEVEEEAVYA